MAKPHLAIMVYPGAQMAAVLGLTDLFIMADREMRASIGSATAELRVTHLALAVDGQGLHTIFDSLPGATGEPDIILLPPTLDDPPAREAIAPILDWLVKRRSSGSIMASVCAGAFLLAESGLLEGRRATTHWSYARRFEQQFPAVKMDIDQLLIDDGDILTAGGLMAWTDLGLRLVERLFGATVMLATARVLLVDPPGREQRYYFSFSPIVEHGDAAILKVQHWLAGNDTAATATVAAMAAQAGLEERTFHRRFRAATGLRPIEYCQHLRIGSARDLLCTTSVSIDEIGWRAGYKDAASFRKVFLRLTGLTPGEYRRRFRVVGRPVASASRHSTVQP